MSITLSDALKMAAPHMAKDDTLRTLCGIKITDGVVMATDRYTAARVTVEGVPDAFVPAAIVKQGVISIADNVATLKSGATIALPDMADIGDYPDVSRLFDQFKAHDAIPEAMNFGIDPKHVEKFSSKHLPARSGGLPRFEVGETTTKPFRVTFSGIPEFIGLLVPTRLG